MGDFGPHLWITILRKPDYSTCRPPASSTPLQSGIDLTPALVSCGQSVLIGVVIGECGFATARRLGHRMGIVVQFRWPIASSEVIAKLVELGYLRPAKRHKIGVVENAMERLRQDLHRDGVIRAGDLSAVPEDDKQERDDAPAAISSPDGN
jgi:hypothetical protein